MQHPFLAVQKQEKNRGLQRQSAAHGVGVGLSFLRHSVLRDERKAPVDSGLGFQKIRRIESLIGKQRYANNEMGGHIAKGPLLKACTRSYESNPP